MNLQPLDHYRLSITLTVISTALLTALVFRTGSKNPLTRRYGYYLLSIFIWSLAWYEMVYATTPDENIYWGRLVHVPAVFIPVLFLNFVQTLVNKHANSIYRKTRFVFSLLTVPMLFIVWIKSFIPTTSPKSGFPYFIDAGPIYYLFPLFFFSIVTTSLVTLYKAARVAPEFLRRQIAHIFGAYSIAYVSAIGVFLPIYGRKMPLATLYFVSFAHFWMFYAIVRHRLLDIRVVIRRTSLLLGIYGFLLLMLIPALRFLYLPTRIPLAGILIAGAVLSIGPVIYAFVVRRSTFFHKDTVAGLTHEMKTPLAAIQSALEIIQGTDLQSSAAKDNYLNMIQSNTTRLQKSIESLLNVIDSDRLQTELHLQETDLRDICGNTVESFRQLAELKHLDLKIEVPSYPILANIDRAKMSQAVSNVISNAIKFTDKGGVSVELSKVDQEIKITVTDTGPGIPPDEIPRIFDRFYQGKLGRQKRGTGIGLTLAKQWVEAHGGRVGVGSDNNGRNATIIFVLRN